MNSESVLFKAYSIQLQTTVKKLENDKKTKKKSYRWCLYWMVVGALIGGIVLACLLTLYLSNTGKMSKANIL